MNIRLLHEEDWNVWKAFRHQSLIDFPLAFPISMEEEERLSDQQFKDWITRNTIYGAFLEDQMIGSVGIFKLESSKEKHRGVLFGMNVLPAFQGRGLGGELMTIILKHARKDVLQLHLTVVSSNQTAVRLYQRHGFKIYGTEPRSLKVDDHFYDHHLMVLFFD
ncbi:MAG: GNAT family N-acetyltransferase [Chthoniobacterales bacterium]|nr:GNAT family N-acetyltransferase [Chthoniobacterales bacterium]